MTNKRRVINAIHHKETDFAPYSLGFTKQEHKRVADYLNDMDFDKKINNHISNVYYDGWPKEIERRPGYFRDDFGVTWNRNGADKDIGVIEGFVIPEPAIGDYKFPEIDEQKLRRRIIALTKERSDNFTIANIGFSMFERAWSMRGMENFLVDMIAEPEFADEFLDEITNFNLKIIDLAMEYDIDGMMLGDDWGQQSGLIMGPVLWRRFIKPRMAKMYRRVKDSGKFVLQHSCGDIHEIFPDLVEIGLDVYQTFQPEIYDIKAVKAEFGNSLTFWGGISAQRLLPFASTDEVRRVTKETIDIMRAGGGYIAGPTHAVPGDVPPENAVAMLDVFANQNTKCESDGGAF